MTIFATRGRGLKSVIDIVKKPKFKNFEQDMCCVRQKKAKNTQEFISRQKKVCFIYKN